MVILQAPLGSSARSGKKPWGASESKVLKKHSTVRVLNLRLEFKLEGPGHKQTYQAKETEADMAARALFRLRSKEKLK